MNGALNLRGPYAIELIGLWNPLLFKYELCIVMHAFTKVKRFCVRFPIQLLFNITFDCNDYALFVSNSTDYGTRRFNAAFMKALQ